MVVQALAVQAATDAALKITGAALSAMAQAIKGLYGMAGSMNDYLDKHLEDMKASENHTISRTGGVLQMAKLGFGIGYITPVVVIAVGQLLLGNTFSAVATVATAATLTNPIAMTCAAVGAIYYGWGALSDLERNELLEKLSKGLEIGIELIRSIVRFIIDKTKELLSSKNIEEIKKFIGSAAGVFGKTLGDVTHKVSDVVGDTFNVFKKASSKAMERTKDVASDAYHTVSENAEMAAGKTMGAASDAYRTVAETAEKAAGGIRNKLGKSNSRDKQKKLPKDQ